MSNAAHVSRVRSLYKAILRLHRGMPVELQALGDQYVKEEFRRHKSAEPKDVGPFMLEWTAYYATLAKQLAAKTQKQSYGKNLDNRQLDAFNDEQIGQIFELYQESKKPIDPENPLGEAPTK
ncbi:unnamed protein product [Owenia fusiformis]|uniref:Succinate dehydrogenase assembly factor 3 n=1 Tax=Owenia fusiformis TaxID=6347 RepID=A0A8S4N4J4_OWEFU|nr:unnamed protein product [Owenia fusiformis]